ncbi:MAG TPA: hypothetical protein PKD45_02770 [Flavobacteriales bacterium]|nr:hypothetical protein [Flavobacteriales bacterium]
MLTRSLIIAIVCATIGSAQAQTECVDFWKSAPRAADARFAVNGQSRAASVQVGVPTELNIIIYKGQDYRVSVVYDEKILGKEVAIRIIEKVRGPKKPANGKEVSVKGQGKPEIEDVEKVIWDNQEHEMANEVEFTATSTKRIAIEVMAPGPENPKDGKRGRVPQDIGCLGILIEHMPTPAIGF